VTPFTQGIDQAIEKTEFLVNLPIQDFESIRLQVSQVQRDGQLSVEAARLTEEVQEFAES
jgi:hypothetical protein